MKHRFGSFLAGAATFALAASLTFSAVAISGRMTIEVDPINVQVNGEVFAPTDVNGDSVPVFAYNGTTYAPLRALAEAYGLEVGYDAESNMATVADNTDTNEPAPTITPSKDSPDMDYSKWTDEEEAIYRELVEEWEYSYDVLDESRSPNRAVYSGKPKSGKTNLDKDTIAGLTHIKELVYRVSHAIDTTGKKDIGISYPFGIFGTIGTETATFIPADI